MRKAGVSFYRGQMTRSASFVGNPVGFADTQYERGIVIEEKRCHVIIEDEEQNIGLLLCKPVADGLVALKNGSPDGVFLFLLIKSEPNCG